MSDYAPRSGCPLCSIVSSTESIIAVPDPASSPLPTSNNHSSSSTNPASNVVYKDSQVTAYIERTNPVSSKGHVIVVINIHVPSIYSLSSIDLPLLLHMQEVAIRLLGSLNPVQTPHSPLPAMSPVASSSIMFSTPAEANYQIGFITYPFYDPKIPINDHLHLHAYIPPMDLANWWRKLAYSGLGWYAIDDLIAEIREQTSNNRIKSAYPNRSTAPINLVPDAGAQAGYANGVQLSVTGVGLGIDSGAVSPVGEDEPDALTPTVASSSKRSSVASNSGQTTLSPPPTATMRKLTKKGSRDASGGSSSSSIPLSSVSYHQAPSQSPSPSPSPTPEPIPAT